VVNRQSRHKDIRWTDLGQWAPEVPAANLDLRIPVKSFCRPRKHRGRCVKPNCVRARMMTTDQCEQPPIAGAKIDEPPDVIGKRLQQHRLGHIPVRYLTREVLADTPLI